MAGVNKVTLVGHLGMDPEVKHLESGAVVARLSLATSESYKNKAGEKVTQTEWHTLELWEGVAKVAETYLKKGAQIYVEGKIKYDSYQDEQGNNRKSTKIRVTNLVMLGGTGSGVTDQESSTAQHSSTQMPSNPIAAQAAGDDDDLPF